ncbi:7,8-didemethyl-8-hydroxy-5-deazariboflavin synthase CofG [Pseudorhodoferax sp.]|uniref:7,8-didemethyl-8-hydroxy-5-deazariboflavin synthase CofG n=1 Tax=Pseudorhodoferax sp. TaxID=1993553 RepID=UPI002DD61A12|nr:7,8-didemethyl-8-hydroxy-5-deazariboflavin synthase CofG [Pseudorhodoferax sp.]
MTAPQSWSAHVDAKLRQDWHEMAHAGDARWEEAMAVARRVRDAHWGNRVTYSRKVFVPLTNLCRDRCGYCTFAKQPGEPGAGYLTPGQVMDIVQRGEQLGCKEALFSLGEKPELRYPEARAMLAQLGFETTTDYVVAMCERVLRHSTLIPHVNAGTLTPDELRRIKAVSGSVGLMLESVSRRLVQLGGAHHACPDKVPLQRLRTLQAAGELSMPTTSGILIGIGETWNERIDSLLALASLHRAHGHLQEVIVQNFRAKPGTPMAQHAEPGMQDMLRTLTAARLILPPEVSLQAPPNLSEDFKRYLDAGINDWGGVSPLTADHINPECAWPAIDRLAEETRKRELFLAERLTVYPAYQRAGSRFLSPVPFAAVAGHAREDGLARRQMHHLTAQPCALEA